MKLKHFRLARHPNVLNSMLSDDALASGPSRCTLPALDGSDSRGGRRMGRTLTSSCALKDADASRSTRGSDSPQAQR
jgi:hypothetical protein